MKRLTVVWGFVIALTLIGGVVFYSIFFGVRIDELGYGFVLKHETVESNSDFESLAHYTYFYYEDMKLSVSSSSNVSISPTGKYAIYHDGPSGQLKFFRVKDKSVELITEKYIGWPSKFVWLENGKVKVQFYSDMEGEKSGSHIVYTY